MVKKKTSFGPRLKACASCGEANPPRQFYCKACNQPFYSEEYFASRTCPKEEVELKLESEMTEYISPPKSLDIVVDQETVRREIYNKLVGIKVETSPMREYGAKQLKISSSGGTIDECIQVHACMSIDPQNHFIYTGGASVDGISFSGDFMAVLVDNGKVEIWKISQTKEIISEILFSNQYHVKQVRFIRHADPSDSAVGILSVVFVDRVDLFLIPNISGNLFDLTPFWSTSEIPEPFFPTCVDGRIHPFCSNQIELVMTNNTSNFVHYFRIGDGRIFQTKIFGYNDTQKRAIDDLDSSSTGMCVTWVVDNPFRFVAGYSNGQIVMYDVRDTHGPVRVLTSLAGMRRWLVELVSVGNDVFLAALQAGCVVVDWSQFQPIGGDVRTAQCFGMDAIDNIVFSAMSSGIVLSVDRTIREKIRRAMTKAIAVWTCKATRVQGGHSTDSLEEELLRRILSWDTEDVHVELFFDDKRNLGKNLKNLRASDGASNEPVIAPGRQGVPIKCLRVHGGMVAYGTQGGFVHLIG